MNLTGKFRVISRRARASLFRALLAAAGTSSTGAAQPAVNSPQPIENDSVSMPELLTFVEAQYPEAAERNGLEADVVLALQIDTEGRVTDAEVVESAGPDFDQAASAAARKFVFQAARRRGRPVAARILYRYSFRLRPPPQEPAPAPAAVSFQGTLRASVGDYALAGAKVRLSQGKTLVAESVSDESGRFELGPLTPGDYRVTVEAEGFEPYAGTEQLSGTEQLLFTYRLEPKADDPTEIVVRGTRPAREVTRRTVSRRELGRAPGTSGDALRALQNLPGVARAPSLSGVLVVRGNGDQTTPVLVDGMWIPNVYHFAGLSSIVPTEMLDQIDFYPGNFSVRYGRALGGMVDARLRATRGDGKYHGLLQVDLVDARAMLEGPVPLLSGWNFLAGVRRSHLDAWLVPLLEGEETQITGAPVYYDFQLLADTRPTPKSYLRLGFLGADDRFRLLSEGSAAGGALESVNASWGIGAIYNVTPSDKLRLDFSLTMARFHQRFAVSTILVDTFAFGSLARGELEYRFWKNAVLRAGYDVLVAPYTVEGRLPEDPGPNAPDIGSFVTTPTRALETDGIFLQPAMFVEMDMLPSPRTQVITGVRLDYTHDHGRFDVSPRITARHDIRTGPWRTTLKAGTGLFFQPPGLGEVALSDDETTLRSMRSFQNSAGVEQALSEGIELSLEGFYNLLDELVSRQAGADGVLRYNNFGTGRIFGAEAMLRYADDGRFFGWLSYTLSRSERTWVPGEPSALFGLDQTHILTALGSVGLGRGWEIGGRFRYVTGNLYTPCRGGTFSAISTTYLCLNGSPNSRRLPPFHQLDVRLEKNWVFTDFTLGAYIDLINAYNRENPDFISYNFNYSQSRPQSGSLPLVPSLGLRGEF